MNEYHNGSSVRLLDYKGRNNITNCGTVIFVSYCGKFVKVKFMRGVKEVKIILEIDRIELI